MQTFDSTTVVRAPLHGRLLAVGLRLIMLKDYTEMFGPDEWYTSEKEQAWQQLRELLADHIRLTKPEDKV